MMKVGDATTEDEMSLLSSGCVTLHYIEDRSRGGNVGRNKGSRGEA